MIRRFASLLVCLPLVAAVLSFTATSSSAASYYVSITSKNIGFTPGGNGYVTAKCYAQRACYGSIGITGSGVSTKYAIPARSTKAISIRIKPGSTVDPYRTKPEDQPAHVAYRAETPGKIWVNETTPNGKLHGYSGISLETQPYAQGWRRQYVAGTIASAPGSGDMTNVRIGMYEIIPGGSVRLWKTIKANDIAGGTTPDGVGAGYSYLTSVPLSWNGAVTRKYRLRIEGTDENGNRTSWWWVGSSANSFSGGSRDVRDASVLTPNRFGTFRSDFKYARMSGNMEIGDNRMGQGIDIKVASTPRAYYGSNANRMDQLDIPRCANVFGTTTSAQGTGDWSVDFLPADAYGSTNSYMVGTEYAGRTAWRDERDWSRWESCHGTTGYKYSRANLIKLGESRDIGQISLWVSPDRGVAVSTSKISKSLTAYDRAITIRSRVPGVAILDSPVVKNRAPGWNPLPPGQYWVEVGRQRGCHQWVPSVYPNNNGIFNGTDRISERWKTVAGKYAESSYSYTQGYKARTPPRGYAGWAYRQYCGAIGQGYYKLVAVPQTSASPTLYPTNYWGAMVNGRVKRKGGKTNKELLVTLYSADGTKVIRTDLTNNSGVFSVKGLASGSYRIGLNLDSWRGNKQSFSGRKTIKVSRGKVYNVGTLTFQE